MSEEKKEPWLNYLALTTVILAVCATLSTFKGGSYSTRSVLSQTQAANQWSYYQSKSIKGYLYEVRLKELEIEIKDNPRAWPPATMADYRKLAADYTAQIERYEGEKAQIQAEARKLEVRRDHAQAHSQTFGMAVIFLQIAILLSSVAALLKRRPLWYAGMAVGIVGVFFFVGGFLAGA
jgi:hypothetical protein